MSDFYEELEESYRTPNEPSSPTADEKVEPWGETRIVGKALPRVDAYERVSGAAQYTADVILPDMIYAAILRCPHAHAIVKSIDTSAAEKSPGVVAVLTGKSPGADIPWYGGRTAQSKLFDPHCRYEGEEVAAVAAQTPYQAFDALKAIQVEYENLPFVIDDSAFKPSAPKLHESGNTTGEPRVMKRGDIARGFSEADVVREESFSTSVQIHVPMEAHGSVVKWDGEKLTVWDSTQGVYDGVLFPIARALNLPLNNVRVISKYFGGGFGSKLELGKYTVIAALLSRKTGRPVKITLTREETLLCAGNRPGAKMTLKAGVKKDGTLTALQLSNVATPGAYASGTGVGFQVAELYKCPNILISESGFYTNAGRARAFRAPGFPPGNWPLEQMMDMLAEKIGMDPIDIRLKNFTDISQTRNMPYTSTGLRECLIEGAQKFGWKEARAAKRSNGHIKRGVGVAAGMWQGGNGSPPYTAEIRMFVDGGITVKTGAMDIGTGTKTCACMVAAEELGVPLESVRIENADTSVTPYAQLSGGSMTLPGLIPAVRKGAWLVKRQILTWASESLGLAVGELELKGNLVVSRANPEKRKSVEELMRAHGVMDVIGIGNRDPNPANKATMPFAAHFAEVEVNTKTGEIKVVRLLGANESGRVINLKTFNNQVFGGMTMALGFGLTEKRVLDAQTGKMCNANMHDYKVPTALDVPVDHTVVAIDPKDTECNIVGCKGSGEPAHVPTASAIANAIYNAIGVRPTCGPIEPKTILELLSDKKRG
ncbi:MAG TPA: xanthine dehydrogenase family protein molybdopterin-binding subunit [Acidobacteriota bacterium]|nr:xanthine dehydrogenase family protein molybdopterin-binding subunit [Acidobacteriota bacterium]